MFDGFPPRPLRLVLLGLGVGGGGVGEGAPRDGLDLLDVSTGVG